MAHDKVYGICENLCKVEVMSANVVDVKDDIDFELKEGCSMEIGQAYKMGRFMQIRLWFYDRFEVDPPTEVGQILQDEYKPIMPVGCESDGIEVDVDINGWITVFNHTGDMRRSAYLELSYITKA